MTPKPSIFLK